MALALFHKHLLKNRNIFERGIGEIGFFLLYWVLVLPIGPCYSLVEEQQLLFLCGVVWELFGSCLGASGMHPGGQ